MPTGHFLSPQKAHQSVRVSTILHKTYRTVLCLPACKHGPEIEIELLHRQRGSDLPVMDGAKRPRRDPPPDGAVNPPRGKGKGKGKGEGAAGAAAAGSSSAGAAASQGGQKGKGKKGKHDGGSGDGGGGAGRKRPQFGRPPPRPAKDSTSAMPRTLQPLEYAEARASEIAAMVASLAARHGAKRVHQVRPKPPPTHTHTLTHPPRSCISVSFVQMKWLHCPAFVLLWQILESRLCFELLGVAFTHTHCLG